MRFFCLFAISCAIASAQLVRNTPLPKLFDDSDTVFFGHTMAVREVTPPSLDANGKLKPRDWIVTFSVVSEYKGRVPGLNAELSVPNRYALWGEPAFPGMNFLVFARDGGKTLALADDQAMLPVWDPPASSSNGKAGLARMESDLLAVGTGGGSNEAAALEMLFRFPSLNSESIRVLSAVEPHGWDDRDILRLELIARQGSPADIEALLDLVVERDGATIPALMQVDSIILEKTGAAHLPILQRLSDANLAVFRGSAMEAIRRLADPRTIPFLIAKLRAADKVVAYEALMAVWECPVDRRK